MNRITLRNPTLHIARVVKSACLALAFCAAVNVTSSAQIFKTLVYFDGKNGGDPLRVALVQGTDGNLYGTTASTAFKMTPNGTLTTIHIFCTQQSCPEVYTGLLLATDGNFYGVTTTGGSSTSCTLGLGCGTVFKLTPNGAMTVLHSFSATDGAYPVAALVEGTDGSLYGTTYAGGSYSSCINGSYVGCGTVFKITRAGALTTLHNFNGSDGSLPSAPLIQAIDGNYYGTTSYGGAYDNCPSNTGTCGTVFKITPSGSLTTLHSFNGGDGGNPIAGLYQASNGNFYGATYDFGEPVGVDCAGGYPLCGTVFKITPTGELTTLDYLHGYLDAGNPTGTLIRATDGNFYGASSNVFEMTAGNVVEPVFLTGDLYGTNPYGSLFQATNGVLYGMMSSCLSMCEGEIFSLNLGVGPFVTFILPSGKVGGTAQIIGQNLTRTTKVTFNGVPAASFKVISDTYLTAVVPTGATTGLVVITNRSGTLESNKDFNVTQ
jgi:uncharacterized repeat protein (TIGR03803 family)